jgi:hypothetical protein
VVATGRLTPLHDAVVSSLARFGLHADAVHCQPIEERSTAQHKIDSIRAELLAHPTIRKVKFYDDDADVLRDFRQFAGTTCEECFTRLDDFEIVDAGSCWALLEEAQQNSGVVEEFIEECHIMPTAAETVRQAQAVAWLRGQLLLALGHESQNLPDDADVQLDIVGEFAYTLLLNGIDSRWTGSAVFGCRSDVDVCIAINNQTVQALDARRVLLWLQAQLYRAGCLFVYFGDSARCPRLAVKLQYADGMDVEVDMVSLLSAH